MVKELKGSFVYVCENLLTISEYVKPFETVPSYLVWIQKRLDQWFPTTPLGSEVLTEHLSSAPPKNQIH